MVRIQPRAQAKSTDTHGDVAYAPIFHRVLMAYVIQIESTDA
jgi:hypothetical protein